MSLQLNNTFTITITIEIREIKFNLKTFLFLRVASPVIPILVHIWIKVFQSTSNRIRKGDGRKGSEQRRNNRSMSLGYVSSDTSVLVFTFLPFQLSSLFFVYYSSMDRDRKGDRFEGLWMNGEGGKEGDDNGLRRVDLILSISLPLSR